MGMQGNKKTSAAHLSIALVDGQRDQVKRRTPVQFKNRRLNVKYFLPKQWIVT